MTEDRPRALTDDDIERLLELAQRLPPAKLRGLLDMHEKYIVGRAIVMFIVAVGSIAIGLAVALNNGMSFLHQIKAS